MLNRTGSRPIRRHLAMVVVLTWSAVAQSPPVEPAWATWVKRSSREVEELIQKQGPTKPDWLDSVPFDHPQSLDLSWPTPKRGEKWNPQRNPGQYLISVVYGQPKRWRSTAKLFHHIIDINDKNATARQNAMDRLAHVYTRMLGDYARGAYWWRQLAKERGSLGMAQAVDLAECYWRLGSKHMAEEVLEKLDGGTTKLWSEMGELDKAIAAARQEARGGWPYHAMLAAANACRSHGKYDDAVSLYKKLAKLDAKGQRPKEAQRLQTIGQESIQATEVFDGMDLGKAKDGTYTATGQGFRGPIQVSVTIQGGKIRDVKVGNHREDWYFRSLTDVPERLVEHQGVKGVDAITGATNTSNGIVNATGIAIGKALR